MTDDLNPNKIAVEFLQKNIDRILKLATAGTKGAKDQLRLHLESTYSAYISRLVDRYARGKSFFVRSEPLPIYDFFVPLDLSTGKKKQLTRPTADDLGKAARFAVIVGSGGSGKSMMMRHVLLSALYSGSRVPAFFELRSLNGTSETLKNALLRTVRLSGLDIDSAYFELALKAGHFHVILDGYDEVDKRIRARVSEEVRSLADEYPKNWITMSSRPDRELDGWDAFTVFKLAALTVERAVELIQKVPYDEDVKKQFVDALHDRLFAQHGSFLSNPLLLSIMMLTYSDVADVSYKVSTFYNQAYEALFHRHDALKSGFKRDRQTDLDIQDFAKVFAAFSMATYEQRAFSMSETRALEAVELARDYCSLDFSSEAYLRDSIQAVCLMIEEGVDIAFAHRSFQEYFAARFIQSAPPEDKEELVRRVALSIGSDAVMGLLHELDPYIVERAYILPALDQLRQEIGMGETEVRVKRSHYVRYLRYVYSELSVHDELVATSVVGLAATDPGAAHSFAFGRYRSVDEQHEMYDPDARQRIVAAFRAEYAERDKVRTARLRSTGVLVQTLMRERTYFSGHFLQALIDIAREIRANHAKTRGVFSRMLRSDRKIATKGLRAGDP